MDPRVEDHAQIIVDHSIEVEPGDEVLINAPHEAKDLVVALHQCLADCGAFPLHRATDKRSSRAFTRAMDPDDYGEVPEMLMQLAKAADILIAIQASSNTHEGSDVQPEKRTARAELMKPYGDEMKSKPQVVTQHPASGDAQAAEMSSEAYADFVYTAVNKDWTAQREFQSQMVEILDPASEVRIVSGETTDITMSVEGNNAVNDYGEQNLPGGEVFTAPVPESVEGEVLFDMPAIAGGREIEDASLVFEDGQVVEYEAGKNQEQLAGILDVDDGARRVGELGIGMNRDITQFTHNRLFDEKLGDTIHLALGYSIPETVGSERDGNESAVHVDMIVDMKEDSFIEVDGEVVQRDGTFRFE